MPSLELRATPHSGCSSALTSMAPYFPEVIVIRQVVARTHAAGEFIRSIWGIRLIEMNFGFSRWVWWKAQQLKQNPSPFRDLGSLEGTDSAIWNRSSVILHREMLISFAPVAITTDF